MKLIEEVEGYKMKYVCADCGRKISREELEDSKRIVCPECNSYSLRKLEEEEERG